MKKRKSAYLQLTRKCNNECVFCSNPQFEKDYSLDEAKKRVLEFRNEGITEIFLTGGEPTIVPFLPKVIEFMIKQRIIPRVITNGVKLSNKQLAQKLYNAGLRGINISIHSHLEKVSDELTQKEGHYKKTIQGIKNSIECGMSVSINSTINSKNCSHLLTFMQFMVKKFPEVNHYVFNNLDPGCADGRLISRAGQNPWIVAKLTDFELELKKMTDFLQANSKTFRIERVPLCYMQGFEQFSTETRKIVKGEIYICSFIEKGTKNIIKTVKPFQFSTKVDCCKICKLNPICNGIQKEYLRLYGDQELFPIFKEPSTIISKIKKSN